MTVILIQSYLKQYVAEIHTSLIDSTAVKFSKSQKTVQDLL